MAVTLTRRVIGRLARQLGQPELVSAFYAGARAEEHEAIGIAAALSAGLSGEDVYVDVGSNRGQVLREAVRIAPRGRHVAFEPIPALAAQIAREFPGVDCRRKALGAARAGELLPFHTAGRLERTAQEPGDQRRSRARLSTSMSRCRRSIVELAALAPAVAEDRRRGSRAGGPPGRAGAPPTGPAAVDLRACRRRPARSTATAPASSGTCSARAAIGSCRSPAPARSTGPPSSPASMSSTGWAPPRAEPRRR